MSQKVNVVSTVDLTKSQLAHLRSLSPRVEIRQVPRSAEALRPCLGEVEVLITNWRWQLTGFDPILAPRLRWIQLETASVEALFNQPIIATDVTITNVSGIHAIPMAEYVIASIMAFTRHFPELQRLKEQRIWAEGEARARVRSAEIRASTLGTLGYGSIGRQVARLGSSLGMRILASKRDPAVKIDMGWQQPGVGDPEGSIPEEFFGPDRLYDFLSQCDYVVLTAPLTPETEQIIDESALRSMRSHAYLVNVGRGRLIDEPALIRALREGWIAGAGLDVAETEPLPAESPLYDLPNLILTPHVSGLTAMYGERAMAVYIENLRRYLAGESLINVIDRNRGY